MGASPGRVVIYLVIDIVLIDERGAEKVSHLFFFDQL